jgi:hypothetical protein
VRRTNLLGLCAVLAIAGCSLGGDLAPFNPGTQNTDVGSEDVVTDVAPDVEDVPDMGEDAPSPDLVDASDRGDSPDVGDAADPGDTSDAGDAADAGNQGDDGDAGGCVPTGEDEPDWERIDADCDGIDGNMSTAVFVSPSAGDDDNDGRPSTPVATLAAAIVLAQEAERGAVYLEATEHHVASPVYVPSGIGLHGGYVRDMDRWTRPPRGELAQTQLRGSPPVLVYSGLVETTRLDGVTVQAAEGAPGESSVAVVVVDSQSQLYIEDTHITAATGGTGSLGQDGGPGDSGVAGGNSDAGSPGDPGENRDCRGFSAGGRGGAGGVMGSFAQQMGRGGEVGGQATPGGAGGGLRMAGSPGHSAVGGSDGEVGRSASADGQIVGSWWVPLGGEVGDPGGAGGGGGGGGGGAFNPDGPVGTRDGGGGGGGGGGGCGGNAGPPGGSGGASIGLLVIQSTVTLRYSTVASSEGGAGGPGGGGGIGGAGGAGGDASVCRSCTYLGGDGGGGGDGGRGANGSGGAGGPSLAVLLVFRGDGAGLEMDETVSLVATRGGPQGAGGVSTCTELVDAPLSPSGYSLEVACCTPDQDGFCGALDACN